MMFRSTLWLLLAFAALPVLAADDPDSANVAELPPRASTDKTSGPVTATATEDLRQLTAETLELMQQAQTGLANGQVTEEADAVQQRIVERLQQLAELVRRQATRSGSGQSQTTGSRAATANDAGDGERATGRNQNAGESSQAATGLVETDSKDTTAEDLSTSVWGHLPARQRDRMRSRFSERFLPQYEQLVKQYYEALAEERQAEPSIQ